MTFVEEKVYNLGDRIIKEPVANLGVQFDPTDPLHIEIYTKLNEMYTILRDARDVANAPPAPIVSPDPSGLPGPSGEPAP
jgi:hypothetical protein